MEYKEEIRDIMLLKNDSDIEIENDIDKIIDEDKMKGFKEDDCNLEIFVVVIV